MRTFTEKNKHVFFGYYDITPFSLDDSLLLAMHAPLGNKTPNPQSSVKIGFYKLADEKPVFNEIGYSVTWCWQQGCRLQWYPRDSSQTVLYNNIINGRYGCIIQDIHKKKIIKKYNRPIYAVSNNGRWGLSLNFSRLQRLRPGYGYNVILDETQCDLRPNNDGIWRIDMDTGEEKLLFSLVDIADIRHVKSMQGAEHYFNHLLFNPDCTRFLFFHIWVANKNKRKIRLFTSDIEGGNIYLLNDSGHTSHYCWKSAEQLLAYSTHKETGTHFYLYDDITKKRQIIGNGVLNEDGHPSFIFNNRGIIVDTYPDKYGDQRLLLYKEDRVFELTRCYSPPKYMGETRCDLHPRMNRSGQSVCFDSAAAGKRQMYVMKLENIS
ncbi:MAG: hypothetical protein ACMUJM_00085 [bacterium]